MALAGAIPSLSYMLGAGRAKTASPSPLRNSTEPSADSTGTRPPEARSSKPKLAGWVASASSMSSFRPSGRLLNWKLVPPSLDS